MRKQTIEAKDLARKFDIEELFFSTTNRKGIITSCNEVFTRIGGYEPQELLGEPHNVIRHPDMPRCVFKLLWDYLLNNKLIAAYVKNMAKTGEYYWVMAVAAPIDEGFLSIRLKPTSPIFEKVRELYSHLLKIEQGYAADWRQGMEVAYRELQMAVKNMGFESYDEFMGLALSSELKARANAIKDTTADSTSSRMQKTKISFDLLEALNSLKNELLEKKGFLMSAVKNLTLTSLNSSVRATAFGEQGRTLSVISSEISFTSEYIRKELAEFDRSLTDLFAALNATTMDACLANLQSEISAAFKQEGKICDLSNDRQVAKYGKRIQDIESLLISRSKQLEESAATSIASLSQVISEFNVIIEVFSKVVRTLRFAYVTGKIEASRLAEGDSYVLLLDELNNFTDQTDGKLDELSQHTGAIQKELQSLIA